MDEETITKETKKSFSKQNSTIIKKGTTENQDNLIESDILEIGTLKGASRIGQLKDDGKYISSNDVDRLQDNFLKS